MKNIKEREQEGEGKLEGDLANPHSGHDQFGWVLAQEFQGRVISLRAEPAEVFEGEVVKLIVDFPVGMHPDFTYDSTYADVYKGFKYTWQIHCASLIYTSVDMPNKDTPWIVHWDTNGVEPMSYTATVRISDQSGKQAVASVDPITVKLRRLSRKDVLPVTMRRTAAAPTPDLPLWLVIQNCAEAISFDNYGHFMDLLLCGKEVKPERAEEVDNRFRSLCKRRFLPYNDVDAYRLLKVATEAFLIVNCGVVIHDDDRKYKFEDKDAAKLLGRVGVECVKDDLKSWWENYLKDVNGIVDATIPYLALVQRRLKDLPLKDAMFTEERGDGDLPRECYGILSKKLTEPCLLELIWSYWHEEGMLVQTMNAISRRFQNVRGAGDRDPLAMLEIDPLRPLNNLLWGYIQDEQHRLSLRRRVYEYNHQYGLTLHGKAVPPLRPADSRSNFLEAFHNLLYLCAIFYQQDDDTTVIADGFPVMNALREVHFLLAEGAHNQFGDLPSTARQEMLLQQWLLARPEFREFLPSRIMVAYPEEWMDRVDAMKRLQGWTDVSVREFNYLGVYGEQILLSIRYGAWGKVDDPAQAANWARFWRPQIQGYIHAYRAVTSVDLTAEVTDVRRAALRYTQPSILLRERLAMQHRERPGLESPLEPGVIIPSVPVRDRLPSQRRNL